VIVILRLLRLGLDDSQVCLDLPSQTWVSHVARIPETNDAGHLLEQLSKGSTASKTLSAAAHEQNERTEMRLPLHFFAQPQRPSADSHGFSK
jgi:hypothetical protein